MNTDHLDRWSHQNQDKKLPSQNKIKPNPWPGYPGSIVQLPYGGVAEKWLRHSLNNLLFHLLIFLEFLMVISSSFRLRKLVCRTQVSPCGKGDLGLSSGHQVWWQVPLPPRHLVLPLLPLLRGEFSRWNILTFQIFSFFSIALITIPHGRLAYMVFALVQMNRCSGWSILWVSSFCCWCLHIWGRESGNSFFFFGLYSSTSSFPPLLFILLFLPPSCAFAYVSWYQLWGDTFFSGSPIGPDSAFVLWSNKDTLHGPVRSLTGCCSQVELLASICNHL